MNRAARAIRRTLHAVCACAISTVFGARAETLHMAVDILPPSLGNPYRTSLPPTAWTVTALFDALTRFGLDGRLQPALATHWENIDELTWRFDLRDDITFHNGAPFTAEAVVTAIDYISSDAASREGSKRELPMIKSARALSDYSVEIVTTEPSPQLPRAVSGFMIAEPNHWRAVGRDAFARDPVGTGPFKMEKMAENEWKLSAFSGGLRKPQVDGLEIVSVP
ncbi:MAG: ABC transporter substrate-binding protein, partial [Rhodobacteraceae bacterium]|nr:ABC transporter substrate-binding protein [Paracoccaceae bacterium]